MKHVELFENFSELTPQKIRQEIKDGGYVSRKDLQMKNASLFYAAKKNNMLDDLFDNKTQDPLQKIRQEIKDGGYVSRKDLQMKNASLFNAAKRNNMLDDLFD
jgi:hypothetical protein